MLRPSSLHMRQRGSLRSWARATSNGPNFTRRPTAVGLLRRAGLYDPSEPVWTETDTEGLFTSIGK